MRMPRLGIRESDDVRIPCRKCGAFLPFQVQVGVHELSCKACGSQTQVDVTKGPVIRTSLKHAPVHKG